MWYELFKENIESENRVSWCGPNLCSCNELWSSKFLKFLDSLTVLSENIGKGLVAGNCIRIVSEASELLAGNFCKYILTTNEPCFFNELILFQNAQSYITKKCLMKIVFPPHLSV